MSFCHDPLGSVPVYDTLENTTVGVVKLIIGILYFVMMFITIGWVKMNEKKARATFHPDATNTVIFPPFVKILWLSALSNAFIGFLMLFVPVEITGENTHDNLSISVLLYPLAWALQHFVVEGVACMLMQKGCGVGAAKTAFKQSLLWAFVTFVLQTGVYSSSKHNTAMVYQVSWSALLLVFFLALWLTPQHRLFRRPACIFYAKFWFFFRVVTLLCFLAAESNLKVLEEVGGCGYVFLPLLGFPILQPLVCYWTLQEDSLWWQGSFLSEFGDDDSPLLGIDLTIDTAIALAKVLDHISSSKSARLINFAHIQTEWRLIGQGSFSKVFAGSYKHVPCALKLVFTTDLTAEDVNKAVVEATLLSSIRSRNIINIFGICVNPPNVMIALELCALGSLFDVLRNERLHLSVADRLFLALGCCRGLHALHSLDSNIVHRDVKSMNFLVDGALNAKLCDLELGQNETMSKKIRTENESEKFLLNWMAPEFIKFKQYTRASDIYSLTMVLWEIMSGEVPHSSLSQQQIAQRVGREGFRPPIPACDAGYCQLLSLGWAQEQGMRPSSADMAAATGSIWRGSFFRAQVVVEATPAFSRALDRFMSSDAAVNLGKQLAAGRQCEQQVEFHKSGVGVRMSTFNRGTRNPLRPSLHASSAAQPCDRKSSNNTTPIPGNSSNSSETLQSVMLALREEAAGGAGWEDGWEHVQSLPEPVLVVTSQSPFLALGASAGLAALLGGSCADLVGLNLDCRVAPESSDWGGGGVRKFPHHQPVRSALLSSFYADMLQPGRAHVVLDLEHHCGHIIKCSVSSFPIHRFKCNPELDLAANQTALEQFKSSVVADCDHQLAGAGAGATSSPLQAPYFGLMFSRLDK